MRYVELIEYPVTEMLDKFVEMTDMVHLALKRNYPHITAEQVAEWVDLGNVQTLFEALVKTSGLVTSAEPSPAGEAAPGDGPTGTA